MEELDFIIESSKEMMENAIIYLEKELVSSSIDCYYNLFFISSMLTSCAFDTSSAAATADNDVDAAATDNDNDAAATTGDDGAATE